MAILVPTIVKLLFSKKFSLDSMEMPEEVMTPNRARVAPPSCRRGYLGEYGKKRHHRSGRRNYRAAFYLCEVDQADIFIEHGGGDGVKGSCNNL